MSYTSRFEDNWKRGVTLADIIAMPLEQSNIPASVVFPVVESVHARSARAYSSLDLARDTIDTHDRYGHASAHFYDAVRHAEGIDDTRLLWKLQEVAYKISKRYNDIGIDKDEVLAIRRLNCSYLEKYVDASKRKGDTQRSIDEVTKLLLKSLHFFAGELATAAETSDKKKELLEEAVDYRGREIAIIMDAGFDVLSKRQKNEELLYTHRNRAFLHVKLGNYDEMRADHSAASAIAESLGDTRYYVVVAAMYVGLSREVMLIPKTIDLARDLASRAIQIYQDRLPAPSAIRSNQVLEVLESALERVLQCTTDKSRHKFLEGKLREVKEAKDRR